jgi:16S rRNA (guanine527-N7)-methyltransferase
VKRGADEGAAPPPLEEVVRRWSLDSQAQDRLATLLALVRDDPRAATSVRDPDEAVFVHVADSLSALPFLEAQAAGAGGAARIADIGSGAGFPGLPLAIALPGMTFELIESGRRKSEFMEEAARALALDHVAVANARAEDWARGEGRERYDAVLARAVAPLAALVEYAAPLLVAGGRLIAWKGQRDPGEEEAGEQAARTVGLERTGVERVHPFAGSRAHNLHLYEKVRLTPPEFPRRAGAARKRPLA